MPSTITASKPAFLSSPPNHPPNTASPQIPVKGDLLAIKERLPTGAGVPVKTPVAKTILFSGPRGSMPGFSASYNMRAAKPLPPRYLRASASGRGSCSVSSFDRFTLNNFPAKPNMADPPSLLSPKTIVNVRARAYVAIASSGDFSGLVHRGLAPFKLARSL